MASHYRSPLTIQEMMEIVSSIRKGEVGLFPTDTVYGLGCLATNVASTTTIYSMKGRSIEKTLPVLIGGWTQFDALCDQIDPKFRKRLEELWPGGLTVVVKASRFAHTLSFHCLSNGAIAIRMPDHPTLRYIIEQLGKPLAATSANLTGRNAALSVEMVPASIRQQVDWIWSEAIPQDTPRTPSTVVDLSGKKPLIIRQGGVRF